ncbi:hypothetical protein [Roseicella aquatilis]|uniref:Uncharacterized protein n=1 Tax=Roseicella aquatilis TaxID=2527868 RepID=A0A4R4DJU9_9PROT|nr:hypothetical protein [Roseicella aquatilis]TCZ60939.1 hypothetical protein EXY23_14315 [Roseicella aquatilis]
MNELARLRELLDADQAKLGVHIRRMNSPGSPVYRSVENVVPAATILVSSFAATALVHLWLGIAILVVGCWWWLMKHLPRVKDDVFDRTAALVLGDERQFDLWWSQGVLSLFAKLPDGTELAATRRDDWRAWVRSLPEGLEQIAGGRERPDA